MNFKIPLFISLVSLATFSQGSIIVFSGNDIGANSFDPHPISDATAQAFDLAASSLGVVKLLDFESAPLGFFSSLQVSPELTVNSPMANIRNAIEGNPDRLYGYNTTIGGQKWLAFEGPTITFNFSVPIQSFGAYFGGVQPVLESQMVFDDGSIQAVDLDQGTGLGGMQFVGFTDAGKSISSITMALHGDLVSVDDLRYVLVPEPSSLVGVGLGLLWFSDKGNLFPRQSSIANEANWSG